MNIPTVTPPDRLVVDRAAELLEQGYVRVPIPQEEQDLIGTLQEEYIAFLARRPTLGERREWSFMVPGEKESDEGILIRHGKNGGDHKFALHWRITTRSHVEDAELSFSAADRCFFAHHDQLFWMCAQQTRALARGLDAHGVFGFSVHDALCNCYEGVSAYSAPVNRQLDYPPQEDEKRAGVHLDRSFITRHMGDSGGHLFASNEAEDELENVSPHPGEVLYFFGVKAYILSQGKIEPLWHGSKAAPGERRLAIPHFAHVHTKEPVVTAKESYNHHRDLFSEVA